MEERTVIDWMFTHPWMTFGMFFFACCTVTEGLAGIGKALKR